MLNKKLNKRYASWAVAVCTGKLTVNKVKEWLELADYKAWEKDYLVPAKRLSGFGSVYVSVIKDLEAMQYSKARMSWYINYFSELTKPNSPYHKILIALSSDDNPLPKFQIVIDNTKKLLEEAPNVIKPLLDKNVRQYESYRDDYIKLNDSLNKSLNVLSEYAGMQLFGLLGIL